MAKVNYSCSQQDLYTVANLGWQSCSDHLGAFEDFKARYNAAYITARLGEITDAANMPDEQARSAESEILRIQLTEIAATCLANWQKLKRYISDAFALAYQKPNLEAAGQNHYAKAGNNDWESCKALLTSGSNFIATKLDELTANDNMPPAFQATFNNAKEDFTETHQNFLASEEAKAVDTENKIVANNNVHAKLMTMFLDGQEIFKDEEATKKQFVFEQVLNLAAGTGTAGLKGTVTDSVTGNPLAGVSVTLSPSGRTEITDEDGKYHYTQLAADEYVATYTFENYQTIVAEQTVNPGVTSTLNQSMNPLP